MDFLRKLFGSKPKAKPAVKPQAQQPSIPAKPQSPPPAPQAPIAPAAPAAPLTPPPARVTPPPASISISTGAAPVPPPAPQSQAPQGPVEVALLTVEGPIWLPQESPAQELYPAKEKGIPLVACIGNSVEFTVQGPVPPQIGGALAMLSRALPLYFSEEIEFRTNALARTLVPWMVKPQPGFPLSGRPWDDATAARHARAAVPDDAADYALMLHLRGAGPEWNLDLRLVRTIDGTALGELSQPFNLQNPAAMLPAAAQAMIELLARETDVRAEESTVESGLRPLRVADPALQMNYLVRLEQLLSLRVFTFHAAQAKMQGEGGLIESQLQLCRAAPDNVPLRLILVQILRDLRRAQSAAPAEFGDRVLALQEELPLAEPAQSVVSRMVNESLS